MKGNKEPTSESVVAALVALSTFTLFAKVEAVAGVSLPMLIRVLTYRDRDLQTIVTKAISGGCEGVMRVPMFKLHNAASGS